MTATTAAHDSKKAASAKDRVIIFDTTLRDGEQSPGATMNFEEKLLVAELLDEMGVDVIEAGFPIASQGDFESVHEIAKRAKNAVIAGLARANAKDIDRCAEAVKPAKRGRIHTVIATSPLHMKAKLQMQPEAVLQAVIDSVTRARNHIDDVEWSCEDGTRSELDFLCRCVEAAIKAGATTVNIPDTVGYARRPTNIARCLRRSSSACRTPTRRYSRCTAITISAWRWRIRWPASPAARGRSNAPSTASASAPATPRSRRW